MRVAWQFRAQVGWWVKKFHETFVVATDKVGIVRPTEKMIDVAARAFRCLPTDVQITWSQELCDLPDKEVK
ncbi:MAG TPA: hypothetical protein VJI73_01140 [Candidatus Paceibacterota bacterium]